MPVRDAQSTRPEPDEVAAPRSPRAARRRTRLTLLDGFELRLDGAAVPLPLPAQRLLAFLALQQQPLRRSYVAGTLWIDSSEEHAAGSLRSALWRLHRPGRVLVESVGAQLRLAPEVGVDVREAVAEARLLLAGDGDCPALADVRLAGDLLPDWYDDWIVVERELLRQLRIHALERLCDRLAAAGRFADSVEVGLAAVRCEPLRESSHRALVRAHLAEGNQADALAAYRLYERLLRGELGLAPSEQMRELVAPLMAR
jgi:DNA-binding SARP family transcriptional activator